MRDAEAWRFGYFDTAETSEYLLMRSNYARFRDFQSDYAKHLGNHFYIIVVSKTLDLLECCLTFLPRNLNLFLILNGLELWEQAVVERNYPHIPKFTLETCRRPILHDRVLDMLAEINNTNFGILDQDCFVLDAEFFAALRLKKKEFAISPFVSRNEKTGIKFPRTYCLLFNCRLVQQIRERYAISFKRCWTIPPHLEAKLAALGFGYDNFPHASLGYFDNFQLLWATAISDGLSFGRGLWRRLRLGKFRIIHVGAGSNYLTEDVRDGMVDKARDYAGLPQLEKEKLRAALFSYYAHLLLLEHTDNEELRKQYLPFFASCGSSSDLFKRFGELLPAWKVEQMRAVVAERRRRSPLMRFNARE